MPSQCSYPGSLHTTRPTTHHDHLLGTFRRLKLIFPFPAQSRVHHTANPFPAPANAVKAGGTTQARPDVFHTPHRHLLWHMRVSQKRTAHGDKVSFAITKNTFTEFRWNTAHNDNRHRNNLLYPLSQRHEAAWWLCHRRTPGRADRMSGNMNSIHASLLRQLSHHLRLLQSYSPFSAYLHGTEAPPDGIFPANLVSNSLYYLQQKPRPVFDAAAISILSVIR